MAEQHPRREDIAKQNLEKPRGDEAPPFTTPRTDPLSTWGTGGSEDDRSGDQSNPRPAQPSPGEPDADTAEKSAWREGESGDSESARRGDDDLGARGRDESSRRVE
jgi:hypothetical protein